MNNKEQFDLYVKNGLLDPEMDTHRVELLANKLIESLYKPTKKDGLFIPDWARIKKEGINSTEPINWGNLKASVSRKGALYIITIDEASPNECPTLCDFIEKYLTAWGWSVSVNTEW